MHPLVGYCDRWSVKPGQSIRFMVSSAESAPFDLRFVRHFCADPNPEGPGYRETPMPTPLDGSHSGLFQPARLGSYGRTPSIDLAPGRLLAVGATIWPTRPESGPQTIVAVAGEGWRITLGIEAGRTVATLADANGRLFRAAVATPMLTRRWYDLALLLTPDGRLQAAQRPRAPLATIEDGGSAEAIASAPRGGPCRIMLAARPGETQPSIEHFNGKLERPTLWSEAASIDEVLAAQRGGVPSGAGLLACWDFARGIGTDQATDIGPSNAHAKLFGLPTRAMTGASWTGEAHDWKQAPEQYAAIHFHDDDQGDLGWEPSFTLDVPADWPSGFYSAHISRGDEAQDYIPFFVRPTAPGAEIVLLVPTFTYQVYGSSVRPGRSAEIRERAQSWGALTELPDRSPEFGLSCYSHHSDGSGVSLVSMRRPMLDTRPRLMSIMDPAPNGSGTARICADSYIVDWLDRLGIPCDIITDHDLHEEGTALLTPYRVVIAGQHPEYHSLRMMDALEDYLGQGGRLIYLGGNGFYWRAEPSETEPHAIEVRRAEGGIRVWATEAGENYHAHGGGYGGLWRRIGRPAHRLVGNGFSVQGRQLGFPYRFTQGITDPRVSFMTEGLEIAPDQSFGDAGFMGGGAAGFELDSVDIHWGTPPHALVVAKGVVIHPDYQPVNEDRLVIEHPKPQEDWSCADMTFFETPAGGAVFSVGSMTYVGSLAVNGYDTVLARLTENVVRRFLSPEPFA
ncbi:MAG TPA: N,N-dimethylformamidase beta subunit family domain-containing protein [Aliidongia sp.]|nr:N,N-dimethylformamidase beta subunit family domain-containing protein [Aliidongia sp.]